MVIKKTCAAAAAEAGVFDDQSARSQRLDHTDGGEFTDPAMRGRAKSAAHALTGADIEGQGYQSALLNGATEARDIVVGRLLRAVGLVLYFCDLA